MGRILLVILLLACVATAGLLFGLFLGGLPGFVQIDPATVLAYPVGDETILFLGNDQYLVDGAEMVSGCYHLTPAQPGQIRGVARRVWPLCSGRPQ